MAVKRKAIVVGDVTIDWNLAQSQIMKRTGALWDPGFISQCYRQDGGAALLGKIIDTTATKLGHEINPVKLAPRKIIAPGSAGVSHSYSLCSPYTGKLPEAKTIWRVEKFLGVDKTLADINKSLTVLDDDDGDADLIIIDDADQGFRHSPKDTWTLSLRKPKADAWVIVKLTSPNFKDSNLLEHLKKNFAGRILLVITVNDLRIQKLRISRELSWERAIHDLVTEFRNKLDGLPKIAKCVVSFYTEGAVVLPSFKNDSYVNLFYDPHSIEGTWGAEHPGKMAGYTQCLTAGIALSFLESGTFDTLDSGIFSGLKTSRFLHEIGFGIEGKQVDLPEKLFFPTEKIADFLLQEFQRSRPISEDSEFSVQSISYDQKPDWSILQSRYPDPAEVVNLAVAIVETGHEKALQHIPIAKFGDFISLERDEIEGMRQIRALIGEYQKSHSQERPLSIAVFGDPGSGKSFAVASVAKSLSQGSPIVTKSFNLSQFASSIELFGAFHQIRDEVLKGKIPLVFWDEFDSILGETHFGWLRYFLAPMQDGTFQQGELTHPIGKSIFIFAGGTSFNLQDFEEKAGKDKESKGPDFLSRLKGFVDIATLNHDDERLNPNVLLRRALLLRSILLRVAPNIVGRGKIQIDRGVLNAFLYIQKYKHGIRSLESVIRMSFLSGTSSYDRSSLPSDLQLGLHVESDEFIRLVNSSEFQTPTELKWRD